MKQIPTKTKRLLNLASISFIVTMIVNYGSMAGWFGADQREISNQYRNFITPEPFTFSIWGLIYSLVIIVIIYQYYLMYKGHDRSEIFNRYNQLFIVTCLFNITWNIAWVQDLIGLSTLLIFGFTITLAFMNTHLLRVSTREISSVVPFTTAFYFGWLTVATVTNVAAWIVKNGWHQIGLHEHLIACLTYLLVALLAGYIIFKIKNPVFNLPIIWAFVGIYATVVNNPPAPPSLPGMPLVIIAVCLILAGQAFYVWSKNQFHQLPELAAA